MVCCSCSKILGLGEIRTWSFAGAKSGGLLCRVEVVETHDSIIAQEVPRRDDPVTMGSAITCSDDQGSPNGTRPHIPQWATWTATSGVSGGTLVSVNGYSVLDASYQALLRVVSTLDDATGWRNTRCAGWTVRDLIHHLLADAQRALVALHTPASGPPDVNAISYWKPW